MLVHYFCLPKKPSRYYEKKLRGNKNANNVKPIVKKAPIEFTVELLQRNCAAGLDNSKPYLTQIDGRTYKVTADTVEEGFLDFYKDKKGTYI